MSDLTVLVGRYLRFKGGWRWHRIREVNGGGNWVTLPTVCGASGDEVADIKLELGESKVCPKCEKRWAAEFVSVAEIVGIAPDFTDGLPAVEFVRRRRGHYPDTEEDRARLIAREAAKAADELGLPPSVPEERSEGTEP